MIPLRIESAWRGTSDCRNCAIRETALFADLTEDDFAHIHAPIDDLAYRTGDTLHTQGQKALGIYTLRSGVLKLSRLTPDGRERILRLLRPGDALGLEALVAGRYDSHATALSNATLCRIPIEVIHHLSQLSPRMHTALLRKWHKTLREADDWLADINFGSARQRVGRFILKMRHDTDPALTTLFAREDMGAMMDLKLETVSREVSHLVKAGAIQAADKQGRLYRILDESRLTESGG